MQQDQIFNTTDGPLFATDEKDHETVCGCHQRAKVFLGRYGKMSFLKIQLILGFLILSGANAFGQNCADLFAPNSTEVIFRDDAYLLGRFGALESSQEVLDALSAEVKAGGVRFQTSRSLHRATEEYPRIVYLDESNPQQQFAYAFSMRAGKDPILEIQSFDLSSKQTNFFAAEWSETGKLILEKNPRKCFGCHSAGRPLFLGMPSVNHWPLTVSEDVARARAMEEKLSRLNIELQFGSLKKMNFEREWIQWLASAMHDSEEVFEKKFAQARGRHKNVEMEEHYSIQREIFLQLMDVQRKFGNPVLTEYDYRLIRLSRVLELKELGGFLDLLSLQVRPNNYELGTGALEELKAWIDSLNAEVGQAEARDRRSWWPF